MPQPKLFVAFYLKVPMSLREFQENVPRYGCFSRAAIAAGVVMEKMWAGIGLRGNYFDASFSRNLRGRRTFFGNQDSYI